jgi:hypothetical protein
MCLVPLLNLSLQIQEETHIFALNNVQLELEFCHFFIICFHIKTM